MTREMKALRGELADVIATNKDLSTALDAANKTIEAMAWEDAKRTETALPEGGWTDIDALPRFHTGGVVEPSTERFMPRDHASLPPDQCMKLDSHSMMHRYEELKRAWACAICKLGDLRSSAFSSPGPCPRCGTLMHGLTAPIAALYHGECGGEE